MPTLRIKSLLCQVTEDAGTDEAYLVANGCQIWGIKSMSAGQGRKVGVQINFTSFVDLKLFDQDGPFDPDDYLGTIFVFNSLQGKGEQSNKFTSDGANYTLYYDVV